MSDDFSPTGNFAAAHLVGGIAIGDPTNQLLLKFDATTEELLVQTSLSDFVADGAAVDGSDVGVLILGTDGSNYQIMAMDAAGNPQMDIVGDALTALQNMDTDLTTIIADVDGIEALLATIDTDTSVIAGAVSGSEMQVDVVTLVPGTGATDLGKAIDSVVGATDTGVALLAKHVEDQVHTTVVDGDYDILEADSLGSLHVNPEAHHVFDELDATTGWTALGNDTLNLAADANHQLGTMSLNFDKVNGAANTVFAGIQKTVSSTDLGTVSPHDLIQTLVYIPALTDVSYVFCRVGTDSSNYNEWRIDVAELTAATWEVLAFVIGDANFAGSTGNGWNASAITYVALGVAFNAETDTLAGIQFDQLSYHTAAHSTANLNSEVSSSVSSANVNLQKINGSATDKGAGNVSNGSQRVVIATDDINLAAIKTAIESADTDLTTIIDDVDGIEALLTTIDSDTSSIAGAIQAEDAAHTSTDSGMFLLTVRNDNLGATGLAGTDLDYQGLQTNSQGRLYVTGQLEGVVAHDAADSGNPIKFGGRAQAPTAALEEVADDDRVDAAFDRQGRIAVWNGYPVKSAIINDSTSGNNTIQAAAGAGLRIAVIGCVIISDGTTDVRWEDGAGGTAFTGQIPLQAREGFVMPIGFSPWFVGTANTLLNLELTATVNVHGIVTYVEMTD